MYLKANGKKFLVINLTNVIQNILVLLGFMAFVILVGFVEGL